MKIPFLDIWCDMYHPKSFFCFKHPLKIIVNNREDSDRRVKMIAHISNGSSLIHSWDL